METSLGIPRRLDGISGFDAVRLWWRYQNDDDCDALVSLLKHNEEDVMNLKVLRERIA